MCRNICFRVGVWVCGRDRDCLCVILSPEGSYIPNAFKAEKAKTGKLRLVKGGETRPNPINYLAKEI